MSGSDFKRGGVVRPSTSLFGEKPNEYVIVSTPNPGSEGWVRVMFTAECDPDGDGWCRIRDCDVGECDCIGPTEEDVEYETFAGELYGRRRSP